MNCNEGISVDSRKYADIIQQAKKIDNCTGACQFLCQVWKDLHRTLHRTLHRWHRWHIGAPRYPRFVAPFWSCGSQALLRCRGPGTASPGAAAPWPDWPPWQHQSRPWRSCRRPWNGPPRDTASRSKEPCPCHGHVMVMSWSLDVIGCHWNVLSNAEYLMILCKYNVIVSKKSKSR